MPSRRARSADPCGSDSRSSSLFTGCRIYSGPRVEGTDETLRIRHALLGERADDLVVPRLSGAVVDETPPPGIDPQAPSGGERSTVARRKPEPVLVRRGDDDPIVVDHVHPHS